MPTFADVARWFDGWVGLHRSLHPRAELPAPGGAADDFYEGWVEALAGIGATEVQARAASKRLQSRRVARDANAHLRGLLEAISEMKAVAGPAPGSREAAEGAAKGCQRCGGGGLATVYHEAPDPEMRVAPTSAAYCVCAMGRWVRKNHAGRSPELLKRIPDLAAVLNDEGAAEWKSVPIGEFSGEDFSGEVR